MEDRLRLLHQLIRERPGDRLVVVALVNQFFEVTVEATGQKQIVSCKIEQSLIDDGDREMLEDLVVAAANQALKKAEESAEQEMAGLAGGMNIPGMGDMMSQLGLGGSNPPTGS